MPQDPYRYFRTEAGEIIDQLTRGAGDLARGAAGETVVPHLLRLAHTLKGAAHVVKHKTIAGLAHQFEDVLMPFSKSGAAPPPENASRLLRLADEMARELSDIGRTAPEPEAQPPAPTAFEETFDTVRVDIAQMDEMLRGVAQSAVQVNGLKEHIADLGRTAGLAALLWEQLDSGGERYGGGISPAALTKARAMAEDLHAALKPLHGTLAFSAGQLERELDQIRDAASALRLVPANAVFPILERAVRNSAQTLGKQVIFETAGGENSLDAHVLAALRDALLHMVRNAVAHGIETPAERKAAGKSESGKVTVRVVRHGNRVAFACIDDGRGFDVAALRRAAAPRSSTTSAAESLAPEELVRLILRGGITTSGGVSEISGRGIGMDIVRQTAARLKADVHVVTEPGAGATIEITVPVSLLSVDAVVVESAGMAASLPINAVQEILRLREADIARNRVADSIVYEGHAIPLLALSDALRQQVTSRRAASVSAVVIRSSGKLAALAVDRLLGTATVVLRPIAPFAGIDPVIAGVSIDAEGNPQIVLDPAGLVDAAGGGRPRQVASTAPPIAPVLVIDDSLTTRMLEQSILESAGYEVDTATSGEEALDKARARNYSLFVVDVEMPGMNGFEFITRTRSDPALGSIPAILVTSRSSDQDRRLGMKSGARAYVVKSEFDQGALLQTINGLVGR